MLFVALLVWAAAEIAAFVVVAGQIGFLLAVILVLGISAAGPFLIRRAGTGVVEHARQRIQRGETPDREVLDGVVLLLGGTLVCVPGFIGDVVGLILLFGPARHAVIRSVGHHLARRIGSASTGGLGPVVWNRSGTGGPVVDATAHDESSAADHIAEGGPTRTRDPTGTGHPTGKGRGRARGAPGPRDELGR